jgi:malonyl-CoA O-methyltransferase
MNAPAALDTALVRRRFERAAATYLNAAVVQREVGNRLLERFDIMKIDPATVLDVGCGPGTHTRQLAARFADARVLAIDHSPAMVALAAPARQRNALQLLLNRLSRQHDASSARIDGLVCDMAALPLAREHADVLWSNFALQWSNDLPALFAEWQRVLRIGGAVMFTAPGPDTLIELRRAVTQAGLDADRHVMRFTDLHDLGDMLVHAGFADPVMDMEVITLEYANSAALWRDLRLQAARNSMLQRPRGLLSSARFAAIEQALEATRVNGGPLRISVEVVYGHAWKVAPKKTAEGHGVVRLDAIRRTPRK